MLRLNRQYILYLTWLNLLALFCAERFFFTSTRIFETITSYVSYPIIFAQGKLSNAITSVREEKQSAISLKQQVEQLKTENENLLNENIALKSSLGYLQQVSELIEFRKAYSINAIATAQIISRQLSDETHTLFIDKGSNDGIEKDMIAIFKNCLVGKISQVYPTYSKILCITDKTCKVASYCYKTLSMGIWQGDNELDNAKLLFVNHLDKLQLDDLVVSSGEGLIFPQGYALGKIVKFCKNDVQYKVNVKPIIDFNKLRYCQIIKK